MSKANQKQKRSGEQLEPLPYTGEESHLVQAHREVLEGVDVLWWIAGRGTLFERTLGRALMQFSDPLLGGLDLSLEQCLERVAWSGTLLPRQTRHASVSFDGLFRLYRRYARTPNRERALTGPEWDLLNWLEGLGYLELRGVWPRELRPFLLMGINAAMCRTDDDQELRAIVRNSREMAALYS